MAEIDVFGKDSLSTGPSSDLQKASALAKRMVTEFGMSDKLGPRAYGKKEEMVFLGKEIHYEKDYSEHIAETIDAEINRILGEAMEMSRKVIRDNRDLMQKIVTRLIEKETLEKEEFEELAGPGNSAFVPKVSQPDK